MVRFDVVYRCMCRFWADVPERLDWSTQSVCRGLTLDVCVCVNRMCEVDKDSRRLRLRRQLGSSRYPHSILGSLFEFVNDLKYRFALREYVCGMFGCESVAERTY